MSTLNFRRATLPDVPTIVHLLADDKLGAAREDMSPPLNSGYAAAFAAIDRDPNQILVVAEDGGEVVGCLQITFIPGLSRIGAWRGQIESVRVASGRRNGGIGRDMTAFAIAECRRRGCKTVQLTTDKSRLDAHRFYARLGFVPSHVGMKLSL